MIHLNDFRPAPVAVDARERLRIVLGAGLGILLTAALCHVAGVKGAMSWIIAPMGASAVLIFGVPASPLAQPWSVVAGNTVAALVGVACARWVAPVDAAAALAVALAIGAMLALRCLHPPGGATALLMALGGVVDPHAVLVRYNQVLDVSRDDLQALINATQLRSYGRRLAQVRCADIMSRELVTVEFGTALQDAWALLRKKGIKALPVVDKWMHLVGIVTLADFMKAAELDLHHGFDERLRRVLRATPGTQSDKPEVVGQIMTRKVRVTRAQRPLADLLPLLGSTGHHHIPVVGEGVRLVGMITQSDVVAALSATEHAI